VTAALGLGEQAAQAIRDLNHHTRSSDAFDDPAELCCLLADLGATAHGLPQLLSQLAAWLSHEHARERLQADTGTCPGELAAHATAALTDAARHAYRLGAALDTAQQYTAHLATA
jgi:hypothetical protein